MTWQSPELLAVDPGQAESSVPGLGWLAVSGQVPFVCSATPGGGRRLEPEPLVPCGELGEAVLLPSLQPLVVQSGDRQLEVQLGPHLTVFGLEAQIGLASSTPNMSEGVTEEP